MEWGVIEKAPKVQMSGKEKRRERVVGDEEFARYLMCASPLLADVAVVLNDTGLRPDELHRMCWEDIDFLSGRHGKLLVRHGKTPAARRVLPLTPRLRGIVEARWKAADCPGDGWIWPAPTKSEHINHSTLKKQHRNAIARSGVRPFLLYSLRHTFATRIASECRCLDIMGWASLSVAMTYIHPSKDRVLNALSDLGGHKIGHTADSGLLVAEREK